MSAVANVAINVDSRGAASKLKEVANRSKELEKAAQGASTAVTKTGRELKTAANGMQYFIDAAGRARKVNGQFVTSTEAAAAGIKKQDTAARSLIGTMTKLAATAGAGRVAAGITRTAAGFEQELRRAAAIEGGGNLDQLRQSIERVASTAAGTPTEVAALATSLSRAGFTAQETSESLQGIVTGAEATSVAFDQLGSIVSSSLRSFGLATSDTASVVDTLVQTANSSNQTILDLGEALSYAAPGARTLGISIGDLSATIGLLADNGIRGSRAGTSLSTGLNRLQLAASGSQEALFEITRGSAMLTKAMDTLGSQVLDAEGNLKPLDEVLLALKGSLDQLSAGQRVELTKALFGEEAGRGFQALLASSEEKIRSMFQTIENAQGKTEQVREEMRGFSDSMKVLGGNVENTTNAIGDKFIVVLQPLVDGLNTTLKAASELPKPIRDVAASAAAAGIAAGGLALALKTLVPTVKLLTGLLGIGGLAGAMAALPWVAAAAGVTALAVAAYNGTKSINDFNEALKKPASTLQEYQSKIDLVKGRLAELEERQVGAGNAARGYQRQIRDLRAELENLEGTYDVFVRVNTQYNEALGARSMRQGANGVETIIPGVGVFDKDNNLIEDLRPKTPTLPTIPTMPTGGGTRGSGRSGPSPEEVLARQTELGEQLLKQKQRELALTIEQDPLMRELLQISYERADAEERVKDAAAGQRDELLKTIKQVGELKAAFVFGKSLAESLIGTSEQLDRVRSGFLEGIKIDEQLQKANQEADIFKQTMQGVGEIMSGAITNAIDGLIDGTAELGDIFRDVLKQLGSLLLNAGLNQLAGPAGSGGILSFLGFGTRANGGPVLPGSTYLVGERGPELLTMGPSGGYVTSNSASQAAMDRYSSGNSRGGSISVNYNVTDINGMRFVTEDQFRAGVAQAAKQGADGGFNRTMSSLKNSRSTRSRVGV